MWALFVSLLLSLTSLGQNNPLLESRPFELLAKPSLLLGKGESGSDYYDVIVTSSSTSGVLFKLPYTKKGGKFAFDLHHRLALTPSFALPAEVTTVVEVITGGGNSIGTYTISDVVKPGDKYDDPVTKVSKAEVDRDVTPFGRKTVTFDTIPGPQSISIVGKRATITRGTDTTTIDTPGIRIASVSNFKFEELLEPNPLKPPSPPR